MQREFPYKPAGFLTTVITYGKTVPYLWEAVFPLTRTTVYILYKYYNYLLLSGDPNWSSIRQNRWNTYERPVNPPVTAQNQL